MLYVARTCTRDAGRLGYAEVPRPGAPGRAKGRARRAARAAAQAHDALIRALSASHRELRALCGDAGRLACAQLLTHAGAVARLLSWSRRALAQAHLVPVAHALHRALRAGLDDLGTLRFPTDVLAEFPEWRAGSRAGFRPASLGGRDEDGLSGDEARRTLGVRVIRSRTYWEGGNIISDRDTCVVGADTVAENMARLGLTEREVIRLLAADLGTPVHVLGDVSHARYGTERDELAPSGRGALPAVGDRRPRPRRRATRSRGRGRARGRLE